MSPRSRHFRRPKSKKSKHRRKAGDAYQDAVAEVARSIDPQAHIEVGAWANGPDGRRDLDVAISRSKGEPPFVVIECKDWNRPIGIGLIDALESKRRDLGAIAAIICSNSGFTEDALRKSQRVGLSALAALKESDSRIRVVVRQQLYTRKFRFEGTTTTIHYPDASEFVKANIAGANAAEFSYNGRNLDAWVARECLSITMPTLTSRKLRCGGVFENRLS